MARIQSVEKSKFINQNIDIYSQNKIGQYSKFLDKNPIFVTYYHICNTLTRTDAGTGGIEVELGPRSPIKFNKILQFPLYNIPEIKPDIVWDETGYDVEMDLNDITILPNTIKPTPGDYFLLDFPGIKQYLFRVNAFRYNTIQSNDFYTIDCDIKDIGTDLEAKRLSTNIVDEYQTVFDNIGTQDRCFVKTKDISYLNNIVDLYYKLRDWYKAAFYKPDLNTFTCQMGSQAGIPLWICDPYLEAFINKSHIYYDENVEDTIILTINNLMDMKFPMVFSKSLYDAVLKRSTELLCMYPYVYYTLNDKRFSTFAFSGYASMTANLIMSKNLIEGSDSSYEYDAETGRLIKHGDPNDPAYKEEIDGLYVDNIDLADPKEAYNIPWYSIYGTDKWIPTWTCKSGYFNFSFIKSILDGKLETNDYCELIIFNYLNNITMEYDRKEIINHLEEDLHNYHFLPMIIYILGQLYQQYFSKDKSFEL